LTQLAIDSSSEHRKKAKRILFIVPALLICATLLAQVGNPPQYSHEGKMILPKDYREWVFLSSGINMSYTPDAGSVVNPRFDNVFVNPAAYQAFSRTGSWPDKTVLILEVRNSDGKVSINKNGRVQTDVAAVEAHVKDNEHGGWSFYTFNSAQQGSLLPKSATCYSCHEQSGAVDTTFVQFYPTLIETAKSKGRFKDTH